MKKSTAIVLASIATVAVLWVILSFHYHNREVDLRTRGEAQQKAVELVFDEAWKVVAQQAEVAEKYKDGFREIYPELMEGRYGNARGGALMSWITESNPQFDPALYQSISRSIEALRAKLTREQKTLADIKRGHDALRERRPGTWFVGDADPLVVKFITSTRAKEALDAGVDDDVSVF